HSSAPLVPCLHLVPPFLLRSARLPLFFLNAPAPTEIYTLSLHDALPISHTRHAYLNADGGYVTDTTATDGQNILAGNWPRINARSEEHTSELQSHLNLVCRLLLEKKKKENQNTSRQTAPKHTSRTHTR